MHKLPIEKRIAVLESVLHGGASQRAAAKMHGVEKRTADAWVRAHRSGALTLESLRERAAMPEDRDPEQSPIFRAFKAVGAPDMDIPPEWDALLNGEGRKNWSVVSAGSVTPPAVVAKLAEVIVRFLDGKATTRDLAAAVHAGDVLNVLRIHLPEKVARARKLRATKQP